MDDLSQAKALTGTEDVKGVQYMRDGKGALMPVQNIPAPKLMQDQTTRRLFAMAESLSAQVQAFRSQALADIDAFVELLRENYGAQRGGQKGNVILMTYDQLYKIERSVGEFIDFGPELETAKVLVTELLQEWSEGANVNLKSIVERAFQVDKKGKIRRNDLLSLLTLEIEDERWKNAMKALSDSILPRGTKEYVRFYRRATVRDNWTAVPIDMAAGGA